MIADRVVRHRITPRRGAFRIEAVTAAGAIELVTTWPTEEQAIEQLRLLQLAGERLVLAELAAAEGPKGPRGRLIMLSDGCASA